MDSRPEQRVVRRLMWAAASFGPAADEPEGEAPAATRPEAPVAQAGKTPPKGSRTGPGSQIRRYVHRPQAPPAKPSAPSSSEPTEPRD